MVEKTDEEALQGFLLDSQCLEELRPWADKFNLFDVLKISRVEIRHSNMLAWLLDPSENHGMGDAFLRGIVQRLVENDDGGRYDVFRLLLLDFSSFSVYREWKNIDLLLVSDKEKKVFVIENKVGSHEHGNQLARYREAVEKEYADYKKVYAFLTPDGEEPSDVENWDTLSYGDVVDVLEKVVQAQTLLPNVKLMVDNYLEVVRRDIVEDKELVELCNKIYNKHKRALDLIYENRVDAKSQKMQCVRLALKELSDEGVIRYDEAVASNHLIPFHTMAMDKKLPALEGKEAGSWRTGESYRYWITRRDAGFSLHFELGGWNIPEGEMKVMQKLIDKLKPSDKRRNQFRYKRLHRINFKVDEDAEDFEQVVRQKVRETVKKLLEWEKGVIASL